MLDHCMVALVLAAGLGNVDVANNLAALLGCHAVHVQAIGAVEGKRVVPLVYAPGGVWGVCGKVWRISRVMGMEDFHGSSTQARQSGA